MAATSQKLSELVWRLREQAEVCQAPWSPTPCLMDVAVITRGFESLAFGVDPEDATRGTRWMSYDTGQKRVVTLIDDVNDACGQVAAPGKLGHRVTACVHMEVLGTGPAPGEGRFSGGHVLRRGMSIGRLPAGWRVVRFDPCWPATDVYLEPNPLDAVALACDAEGKRHQLYHVMSDAIRAMPVVGGPELQRFFCHEDFVVYPVGQTQQVMRSRISPGGRAELVIDAGLVARARGDFLPLCRGTSGQFGGFRALPERQYMLSHEGVIHACLSPNGTIPVLSAEALLKTSLADLDEGTTDQWTRSEAMRWFLERGRSPEDGGVHETSVVVFARQGRLPHMPATVHVWVPGEHADPLELGLVRDAQNLPLNRVHGLRVMPSGDVALLASSRGSACVLQVYENPLVERFTRRLASHVKRVVGRHGWPETRGELVASLLSFGEHHDRAQLSIGTGADGAIHFASTPHHPRLGASIFRFDPAGEGVVELLGDFDRLTGNLAPGDIPSMIHTPPAEVNGRLFWAGQDPFFGMHDFPGMTPLTHRYRGSPLLSFDLATRQFDLLGLPLPGRESIFELIADPRGEELYVREGYDASRWYRQRIDHRFRCDGPPEPLPLLDAIHVTPLPDGRWIYITPERNHWPELGEEDPLPEVMLRMFDPSVGESRDIAWLSAQRLGIGGDDRWSLVHRAASDEQALAINDAGAILRVDLGTGVAYPVAASLELQGIDTPGLPAMQIALHDAARHRVIALRSITRPFVLVSVCVTDLKTGVTEHHGILRDQHGRPMQSISAATLHGGVVYFTGLSWGRPGDAASTRRLTFNYIARVDTVFGRWPAGASPEAGQTPENA